MIKCLIACLLIEVKYFKKKTDFKSLKQRKIFYTKEIKRSRSLQKAEEYLEPKRHFTMELFLRIYLMAYYFCNKSSIIDVRLGYI